MTLFDAFKASFKSYLLRNCNFNSNKISHKQYKLQMKHAHWRIDVHVTLLNWLQFYGYFFFLALSFPRNCIQCQRQWWQSRTSNTTFVAPFPTSFDRALNTCSFFSSHSSHFIYIYLFTLIITVIIDVFQALASHTTLSPKYKHCKERLTWHI